MEVAIRCVTTSNDTPVMKLYHSHAHTVIHKFEDVPMVTPDELSPESTVAQACYSFIHYDLSLLSSRQAGKLRSHEPYCTIANSEHGQLRLKDFTRKHASLMVTKLFHAGYAGGTVNMISSKFRRLFRWLAQMEVVPGNPFDGVMRAPKTPPKRQTRCLTQLEIDDLLAYLDGIKSRAVPQGAYGDMTRLGFSTGLRYGEILSLTSDWLSLDADIPHVTVPEAYSKTRTERQAVLSPSAVDILRKYSSLVPAGQRLFPCSYSALQERLREYSEKSGLAHFFHLTRHTAICEYAAHAQSMSELQAFSGHASKQGVEPYANHDMTSLRQRVLDQLRKG